MDPLLLTAGIGAVDRTGGKESEVITIDLPDLQTRHCILHIL